MNFKIDKLVEFDVKELPINKSSFLIGDKIKYLRLMKNLDLSESCLNICSPSYLSKIENDQIIPKQEVLDKLLNFYQIDNLSLYDASFYETLFDKIIDYVYNDADLNYDEILKEIINENYYKALLIKFSIYVIKKDLINAYLIYKSLIKYLINFSLFEGLFFYYFIGLYFYNDMLHLNSFLILEKVKNINLYDSLWILVNDLYLKNIALINRNYLFYNNFNIHKHNLIARNKYKLVNEFNHFVLCIHALDLGYAEITELKTLQSEYFIRKNIEFYKMIYNIKNYNFEDALDNLNKIDENILNDEDNLLFAKLIIFDHFGKIDKIKKIINEKPKNKFQDVLFMFMQYKINMSIDEFYRFIEINFFRKCFFQNYYLLKFIKDSSQQYFAANSKYKYAYEINLLFEKAINKCKYK